MLQKVLNEDWSYYDNRKKRYEDRFFFSCEKAWEVNYLTSKIQRITSKSESTIRAAIASCCRLVSAPRPRKHFVEWVMAKL